MLTHLQIPSLTMCTCRNVIHTTPQFPNFSTAFPTLAPVHPIPSSIHLVPPQCLDPPRPGPNFITPTTPRSPVPGPPLPTVPAAPTRYFHSASNYQRQLPLPRRLTRSWLWCLWSSRLWYWYGSEQW